MVKKLLVFISIFLFFLGITGTAFAATCIISKTNPEGDCGDPKLFCQPIATQPDINRGIIYGSCEDATVRNVFGRINLPEPLKALLGNDPTGGGGISQFLSNLVILIYSIAGVVLIFMIIWGAFDWMTSGGDKEKLANAQKRIINAVIGIILFAVAFAIIGILGQFTGFKFFKNSCPAGQFEVDGKCTRPAAPD